MTAQQPADPSVFEDTDRREIDISEDQLLGKHTFRNVLYTGDIDIVNVRTGETPARLDKSVSEAKQFVERTEEPDCPPRVAKAVHQERAVETGSPYVSSAFFHKDMTGGFDWHTVFRKAWESDAYDVSHEADYSTGRLPVLGNVRIGIQNPILEWHD